VTKFFAREKGNGVRAKFETRKGCPHALKGCKNLYYLPQITEELLMINHAKRRSKLTPAKINKRIRIREREIGILKDLFRFRYLTSDQILLLHFPKDSKGYCNDRLRILFHKPYHFVDRFPLPVEWGKGSPKLVYTLTKRGSDLLKTMGLFAYVSPQKAYKMKNRTSIYRKHEVAINSVRIALDLGVKLHGWKIEEWITDIEFKDSKLISQLKVFDIKDGVKIPVVPDGFFVVNFPNTNKKTLFFLEMDRGTMEIDRFRKRKIRGYALFAEKWRQVEMFRKYKELPVTFRVLTVVDGGVERVKNLKDATEQEFSKDEDDKIFKGRRFYFTELSKITPETVLTEDIWLVPYKSTIPEMRYPLFLTK